MLSSLSSFRGVPGSEYPVGPELRMATPGERLADADADAKDPDPLYPSARESLRYVSGLDVEDRCVRRGGGPRTASRNATSTTGVPGCPPGCLPVPVWAPVWVPRTPSREYVDVLDGDEEGVSKRNAPAASTADANPWVSTSAARSSPINDALDATPSIDAPPPPPPADDPSIGRSAGPSSVLDAAAHAASAALRISRTHATCE